MEPDEIEFLANRHRGGSSNRKGNLYEGLFAVSKIVEILSSVPKDWSRCLLSGQVANCFVDDLEITLAGQRSLYQIKDVKSLSWGKMEIGTLRYDFCRQEVLDRLSADPAKLFLVNSNEAQVGVLENSKPPILTSTSVVYFRAYSSIREILLNDRGFASKVASICAITDAGLDKLDSLASHILGIWIGSDQSSTSVQEIANKLHLSHLAFFASVSRGINLEAERILRSISGFSFEITGGYLSWRYGKSDSGIFQHPLDSEEFRTFEKELIAAMPSTFSDLEPFLI